MRVILTIVSILLLQGCSANFRLYQIGDMDDFLIDYYTNDLKRISPGIVCDDFKMKNSVGCFKLLVDNRNGKVATMVYDEFDGNLLVLYRFDPPVNYVFVEKSYDRKIESSDALPEHEKVVLEKGQPSLKLIFFEKSALQFYWREGSFHKIWTSD